MFVGALDVRPIRWGPKTSNRPSNPSHSCALPPQPYREIALPWYTAYYSGGAKSFFSDDVLFIYTRVSGGMPWYVVPNPSTFCRFAGIFVFQLYLGQGKFILLALHVWLPPIPGRPNRTIARPTHAHTTSHLEALPSSVFLARARGK